MPVFAIPGTFRIIGASPDGDSIRFYPDDPSAFTKARLNAHVNAAGGAQLRLDAIDALETHYTPRSAPHSWRQPVGLGDGAAGALLDLLGLEHIERDSQGIVTAAQPDRRPGYILTRFADKYGRPDRVFTVPEGRATGLDNLLRVEGQTVTLTRPPEQIVFLEA